MPSARIVIVEHDKCLAETIRMSLETVGHEVAIVGSLVSIETDPERSLPKDLVILDVESSGDSSYWLPRYKGVLGVPFIALVDQIDEGLSQLDAGADDFLVKPFALPELLARVRARLRRTQSHAVEDTICIAGIELDRGRHRVLVEKKEIELSPTEFRLLELLMQKPEHVLSRSGMINALWDGKTQIDPRTVDVYVARLRRALAGSQATIKTARGLGYALKITDPKP